MEGARSPRFGDLLRRYRLAAGLTQEELAERAQVSPRAISDLERGQRNRPWRETVQLLASALRLEPAEREHLEAAARRVVSPAPGAAGPRTLADAPPARHNLPVQVTSFVGRERELAEARKLLATTHLLTLTGPGGIGKTRLALQVAADLLDDFPDGVWFVDLAAVAEASLVTGEVAAALGVHEGPGQPLRATLLGFLRPRQILLLLDNCEHLLDACAHLADLILRGCPEVRILATGRAPLGIAGEVSWRVPSLSVPPIPATGDQVAAVEDVAGAEAARLWVDRAVAAQPAFALSATNAPAVAELCRRLDGIPLAIELAATRVRALSIEQIAARLDQSFRLLTGGSRTAPPRQQTLRALVDWSYSLLSDRERRLFNRLAVFAGGFTLEAVEAVCSGVLGAGCWRLGEDVPPSSPGTQHPAPSTPADVLDLLVSLVDNSLVEAEGKGEEPGRYRLLQTLRQYARERLEASGEAAAVRRRHATYYSALAAEAEPHLTRREQLVYLARLDRVLDNLREALAWYRDQGEAQAGLRLALALQRFWRYRGRWGEGVGWLHQFLALPAAAARNALRARALTWTAMWAGMQGDEAAQQRQFDEAIDIARETGDDRVLAEAMLRNRNLPDRRWRSEGLRLFREVGDGVGTADCLVSLSGFTYEEGDAAAARVYLEEGLSIAARLGERGTWAYGLEVLGEILTPERETEARDSLVQSLALYREVGDLLGVASDENLLGRLDWLYGRHAAAGDHYRASLRLTRDWSWMQRIVQSLAGLAVVAAGRSDPERALRLAAASARLDQEQSPGNQLTPHERREFDRALGSVWDLLSAPRVAALQAEGEALTLEQAIAYALEEDGD